LEDGELRLLQKIQGKIPRRAVSQEKEIIEAALAESKGEYLESLMRRSSSEFLPLRWNRRSVR
jgi:hypothetical protein